MMVKTTRTLPRRASEKTIGLVLVAIIAAHLWLAFGEARGRLVLAVVSRTDLVGRHQIQASDVEMALVRVNREDRWLHLPAAAVGHFVRPHPAPGPVRPMIRAGEPIYSSQIVMEFPLPVQERGLAVIPPSSHLGTVPAADLRPEDRVDVSVGDPPAESGAGGAAAEKPSARPSLKPVAQAVRVLGVETRGQVVRVYLWLTGDDAPDVAKQMLTPSSTVLLVKR